MSAVVLLRRCIERGVRFSLDDRGGVLVSGDDLDAELFTEVRRRRDEIRAVLGAAEKRLAAFPDLAVVEAETIVRNYPEALGVEGLGGHRSGPWEGPTEVDHLPADEDRRAGREPVGKRPRAEQVEQALREAAARAGLIHTKYARLADKAGIYVDEHGAVLGADDAITKLRWRLPSLFLDHPSKVTTSTV